MRAFGRLLLVPCAGLALGFGTARAIQPPERPALQVVQINDPCLANTLEPLLLDTVVNDFATHKDVVYFRRACGAILARVQDLESLRIITFGRPVVKVNEEPYVLLNAFPGLQFRVDEEKAIMVLEGEPHIFYPTVVNLDAPPPPPLYLSSNGALLNYGLFQYGTLEAGHAQTLQSYELTAFGKWGSIGSQVLLLSALTEDRPLRTFTTYSFDDESHLQTWRAGDVYTRSSSWGTSRQIGGLQWARNFSLNPSLITTPVTELDLSVRRHAALALNASDIFSVPQELAALYFGNLGTVPHGPVQVVNIPSGYANRQLRLRANQVNRGPVVEIAPDYYALGLLRQGFSDFSLELGKIRSSFLSDNYRDLLGSATYRHGITRWMTLEGHVETTDNAYALGSSLGLAVPYLGVLDATAAGSDGEQQRGIGGEWSAGITNVYQYFGYRVAYRRFTPHFSLPGTPVNGVGRKQEAQAVLSFAAPGTGNFFIGYGEQRSYPGADPDLNPASRLLIAGYSANFFNGLSVNVFGGRSLDSRKEDTLSLNINLPFTLFERIGGGAYATQAQVTASKGLNQESRADLRLSHGGTLGESTYSVEVSRSILGSEFTSAYAVLNHPNVVATAQLSSFGAATGYNIGASGALALLGGKLFFSEPVGSSFGLIRLGSNYAGVHANGIRADADGDAFLPRLAPFTENPIRLNVADLPLSFQPESLDFYLRPGFRTGVIFKPQLLPLRDVLVQVLIRDGTRLQAAPLGTYATVPGREDDFPAGDDGMIYFYGVGDDTEVTVHYRGAECMLRLTLPPYLRKPQSEVVDIPRLGPFSCEGSLP